MVKLRDIYFRYLGATSDSLSEINLEIKKGEFLLVTGESGCGKTTLTRLINGLCPQYFPGEIKGEYLLAGNNAFAMNLDRIGTYIGNVFQDPRSQFFTCDTTDEIVLAMENRNYSRELMKERLEEIKNILGIGPLLNRNIFQLSSGEKQKIAIAAACAVHPALVVLDEPSSNLDTEGIGQLASLLASLKKWGVAVLVSEHRIHYLSDLLDRMLVMKEGRITSKFSKNEIKTLTPGMLEERGLRHIDLPKDLPKKHHTSTSSFVRVENLHYRRHGQDILSGVSLNLEPGKITCIQGKNGAGKTTFFNLLAGFLRGDKGRVLFEGKPSRKAKRLKSSFFVAQDPDYQLYTPFVEEELLLNLKLTPLVKDRAKELLERLGLSHLATRHPVSLSGGQKQRLLLATALLHKRPLLLLDEPTSGLDGKHMRIIAKLLKEVKNQDMTVLLITHDTEFRHLVADSLLTLDHGVLCP